MNLVLGCVALALQVAPAADWWNGDWKHRRGITVKNNLEGKLEALISGLESGVPEESLAGLWTRCNETFERFKAVHDGRPGETLSDALRKQMEGILRLQAVVSSMAARLRNDLTDESEKVANARARLACLAEKAHVGESCDLSG